MRLSYVIMMVALTVACASAALAQQQRLPPGYRFKPELTYRNASQDPDGIWEPSDLQPVGVPREYPDIYTARLSTPAGDWTLSQITSGCSLQSECPFQLTLKRSSSNVAVADGMLLRGGSAVLSADYSKIFAETYSGIETNPVQVSK